MKILNKILLLFCVLVAPIKQFKYLIFMIFICTGGVVALPMLHCEGKKIVDENGKTVVLRGVNFGSWLLNEIWMTHTYGVGDDKGMRDTLESRFGKSGLENLLRVYRDSYIRTWDFDNVRSLGMNCIRLPFFYKILEEDSNPGVYLDRSWELLDFAISNCAARNIYCIIDMHGAPGGQNSDHTCGQTGVNQLYSSTDFQNRMVDMWSAIADRYKNEPAVAAFDLLNEPWGDFLKGNVPDYNVWTGLYGRAYSAIRKVDPQHIIILANRCPWCGVDELPFPSQMGWSNIVYEFHPYDFANNDFDSHKALVDGSIRSFGPFQSDRDVPVLVGEFHPQAGIQSWAYYLRHFNAYGLNWTIWSYKCHQNMGDWGIRRTSVECNLTSDSYETISNAFADMANSWSDQLQEVAISRHTETAFEPGGPRLETYRNTFSTGDGKWLSDFGKLYINTDEGTADVQGNCARISPSDKDWGIVFLKALASDHEDAWFTVQDSTGCWFEVDITALNIGSSDGGSDHETEIKFGVFRDPIVENPYSADTAGIMTIVDYNSDDGWLQLKVYRKDAGYNNNGTMISGDLYKQFVPGATLGIFVNNSTAKLRYNDEAVWTGAHGADLSNWFCGGICAMTIGHHGGQRISYAEIDNLQIKRPNSSMTTNFYETFLYANGMPLNALTEKWTVRPDDDSETYAQTDAQNPARFDVTGSVCVVDIDIDNFSVSNPISGDDVQFILTFYPEYSSGPVWDYNANALDVEIDYDSTNPGLLTFTVYRHEQAYANGVQLETANNIQFIPGAICQIGFGPDSFFVKYNGQPVCAGVHGIDNEKVFPNGAYVQLDTQNIDTGRGQVMVDWVNIYSDEIPEPTTVLSAVIFLLFFCVRKNYTDN